jgi:hypothetical protein
MSFLSKLKTVAKVAALPLTAPLKLQAKIGSAALRTVARAVPMPGGGAKPPAPAAMRGSPPADSPSGAALPFSLNWRNASTSGASWRGASVPDGGYAPEPAPTPQQASWFPSIAAAVSSTPPAPSPWGQPASPYGALAPAPQYVPGGYAPPAPYAPAPAPTWTAPPTPPPSWGGGYSGGGGGDGYSGGGGGRGPYSGGGGGYDSSEYDLTPDDYPSESTDEEQLGDADATAIDYGAWLGDAGGLGDWKSSLLSVVKGAASGALTATAGALTPKPSAAALAAARPAGMSMGVKLAIGAAVAAPLVFLALRRAKPARAHNPGRRRRRRTSRR